MHIPYLAKTCWVGSHAWFSKTMFYAFAFLKHAFPLTFWVRFQSKTFLEVKGLMSQ